MVKVGIIDYGSGNFASVWNAFEKQGCALAAVTGAAALSGCTHVVLPGVGAFSTAMERLGQMHLIEPLRELLLRGTTPFLGICVGMQVLADQGTEFRTTNGFGAIAGKVEKFDFKFIASPPPLPHMGWNDVQAAPGSVLFRGIEEEDTNFYFVHSYRLESEDPHALFSYCDYSSRFVAALEKGLVFGVQFHPEKSQRNGQRLIANFLEISGG